MFNEFINFIRDIYGTKKNIPLHEPKYCKSNYWLNSIILKNKIERDQFLNKTNSNGVMTRLIWKLMNKLPMFKNAQSNNLKNSKMVM